MSLKIHIDSLTNFIASIYTALLNRNNNQLDAKRDTIEILMDRVKFYAKSDKSINLYVISPVVKTLEEIIAMRLVSLQSQKTTPKEVRELIDFYKSLLIYLHKFNDICLNTKKE